MSLLRLSLIAMLLVASVSGSKFLDVDGDLSDASDAGESSTDFSDADNAQNDDADNAQDDDADNAQDSDAQDDDDKSGASVEGGATQEVDDSFEDIDKETDEIANDEMKKLKKEDPTLGEGKSMFDEMFEDDDSGPAITVTKTKKAQAAPAAKSNAVKKKVSSPKSFAIKNKVSDKGAGKPVVAAPKPAKKENDIHQDAKKFMAKSPENVSTASGKSRKPVHHAGLVEFAGKHADESQEEDSEEEGSDEAALEKDEEGEKEEDASGAEEGEDADATAALIQTLKKHAALFGSQEAADDEESDGDQEEDVEADEESADADSDDEFSQEEEDATHAYEDEGMQDAEATEAAAGDGQNEETIAEAEEAEEDESESMDASDNL